MTCFPVNLPALQGRPGMVPDIVLLRSLWHVVGYIVGITRLGFTGAGSYLLGAFVSYLYNNRCFVSHNRVKVQPWQGPESTRTWKFLSANCFPGDFKRIYMLEIHVCIFLPRGWIRYLEILIKKLLCAHVNSSIVEGLKIALDGQATIIRGPRGADTHGR